MSQIIRCAVPGCKSARSGLKTYPNDSANPQEISFHRFPEKPELRQLWLQALRRLYWIPSKNASICNKHFHESCFIPETHKVRRIQFGSVPTLCLPDGDDVEEIINKVKPPKQIRLDQPNSRIESKRNNKLLLTISRLKRKLSEKFKKFRSIQERNKRYERKIKKLTQLTKKEKEKEKIPPKVFKISDYVSLYCNKVNTPSTEDAEQEKASEKILPSLGCNVCGGSILKFRYVCVQCSDFNMCDACENSGAHDQHYVLRVPALRLSTEIKVVMDTLRTHLMILDCMVENEVMVDQSSNQQQQQQQQQQTVQQPLLNGAETHIPAVQCLPVPILDNYMANDENDYVDGNDNGMVIDELFQENETPNIGLNVPALSVHVNSEHVEYLQSDMITNTSDHMVYTNDQPNYQFVNPETNSIIPNVITRPSVPSAPKFVTIVNKQNYGVVNNRDLNMAGATSKVRKIYMVIPMLHKSRGVEGVVTRVTSRNR